MPTYEIYKKDGTPVRVEGPEGASTEELVELYLSKKPRKRTIEDILEENRARREARRRETPLTIGEQFGEGIKGTVGDCCDRVYVRILEMRESVKIINQCLINLPRGPIKTNDGKIYGAPVNDQNVLQPIKKVFLDPVKYYEQKQRLNQ